MAATEATIAAELKEEAPSSNGWFQLVIPSDGSTVSIKKIVRHTGKGLPVDLRSILKKLKEAKVVHGIDIKSIENLLHVLEANQSPEVPLVIASSDVEEGVDGELRWSMEGIENLGSDFVVAPDMQIAIRRAAVKGKGGKNVLGKAKLPRPVFEPQLNAGFGISVKEDANGEFVYTTEYAGELKYVDDTIFVEIHITVSDDHMKAHMHIPAGKVEGAGRSISEQDILALIASLNVTQGILFENIQSALKKNGDVPCLVKDVLVAQGLVAKDGVNARLVVDEHLSVGKELDDGKIDFYEKSYPWNVKAGEVIGQVIPPQQEEDGFTILGKILSAIPAQGANLVLDGIEEESNGQLKAQRDGVLLANGMNISVADSLVIKGDVCHRIGNIHSGQTVIVKGYVEAGFVVESKGDVIIQDNVEQSLVRSGGNIVVKSGVRGSQSKIISRGNISASFMENASVKALGDITVANSLVSCYSFCRGTMFIGSSNSKKGTLIGGTTYAIKGIVAANMGSEGCKKTVVSVGAKPDVLQKLKKIREDLTKLEHEVTKLEHIYAQHRQSQSKGNSEAVEKIALTFHAKKQELEQLEIEQAKSLAQIEIAKKATVVVHQNVYPGVIIQILDKSYEVKKKENAGLFFLEDELILFRPAT
ncbi:MAG: hypothetical protein ACI9SC_000718 [Gammaproteobacteria bacterium]|jgi:uncharacterized protein (DUF342 family)